MEQRQQQSMMTGGRGESCHGWQHGNRWNDGGMEPAPRQQVPYASDCMQRTLNRHVWAEVKTSEGNSYFYDIETRKTSWTRPQGADVKIIQHSEVS